MANQAELTANDIILMDLINKYGLDQASSTNFQSRMESVVGRLE